MWTLSSFLRKMAYPTSRPYSMWVVLGTCSCVQTRSDCTYLGSHVTLGVLTLTHTVILSLSWLQSSVSLRNFVGSYSHCTHRNLVEVMASHSWVISFKKNMWGQKKHTWFGGVRGRGLGTWASIFFATIYVNSMFHHPFESSPELLPHRWMSVAFVHEMAYFICFISRMHACLE